MILGTADAAGGSLGSGCHDPCRADQPGAMPTAVLVRQLLRRASIMGNLGKAVVAGVGARMLTGSLIGFVLLFLLLYWLLGGH
jgi:hypothetical protein